MICTNKYTLVLQFSIFEGYNSHAKLSLSLSCLLSWSGSRSYANCYTPTEITNKGLKAASLRRHSYELHTNDSLHLLSSIDCQTYSAAHTSRACRVHKLLTMAERLNAYTLSHFQTHAHLTTLFRSALPLLLSLYLLMLVAACVSARPIKQCPFMRLAIAHSLSHSASLSLSLSLIQFAFSTGACSLSAMLCTHTHTYTYARIQTQKCILNAGPAEKLPPAPI